MQGNNGSVVFVRRWWLLKLIVPWEMWQLFSNYNFQLIIQKSRLGTVAVKLLSDECHRTPGMTSQHCSGNDLVPSGNNHYLSPFLSPNGIIGPQWVNTLKPDRIWFRGWTRWRHPIPHPEGKICGVFCEYFRENWLSYKGTTLYCLQWEPLYRQHAINSLAPGIF